MITIFCVVGLAPLEIKLKFTAPEADCSNHAAIGAVTSHCNKAKTPRKALK